MGNRPWQRDNLETFRMLRERLRENYPELHLVERGELVVAAGAFPLLDGKKVVDRYMIEIVLPKTYPKGIPVLREVGGRIPRIHDRHMEPDGRACLFVPDEYHYRHPDGMDLVEFLRGPVLGFFVGQSLVEHGQPWPYGARAHYAPGIIEFYREIIGSDDPEVVCRHLEVLAARELRGHWECPCGSGRRIRHCHRAALEDLRARIPQAIASGSLDRINREVARP